MSMGMRRFSLALNSGRRLSDNSTRRLRKASATISRRPILHMKPSVSVFGSGSAGTRNSDIIVEEPSILDPIEIKEEPTEIQAPMQIYPTTQGRYIWSSWDWMVTALGFTFNVSSIIRCPFLCARYGGVTFLTMCVIMAIFCAIPCCYLEAIIGQFTRSGSLSAWKISPLFQGLGYCFLLLNFLTTFFDNVMTTWAITYLVAVGRSIFGEHDYEWISCKDSWNSRNCVPYDSIRRLNPSRRDSNSEYFRGNVLGQTNLTIEYGLGDMEFPGIEVALTLAGVMIVVFVLAIEVGSKGLSRISILMFLLSSSCMWNLLIRTGSLPGGRAGVNHFLTPDWKYLISFEAWLDAARFVCTTCGVGLGIHLSQASYNPFSTPILLSIVLPISVSIVYCFFSSILVFSLFGFSARITSRNIKNLVRIHPEFVFEYIPITLPSELSFPTHFYLTAFFLIIFCTGLFGSIVRLVNLRLCLQEVFGLSYFGKLRYKWSIMLALMFLSYGLNLPLISNAALPWIAIHQLSIDNIAQPFLILLEILVIAWVVGAKFINEAHICCTGKQVGIWFIILWKFVIPPFIFILLLFGIVNPLVTFHRNRLPPWKAIIGVMIIVIMVLVMVGTGFWTFHSALVNCKKTKSAKLKFLLLISPDFEHSGILESKDGVRLHLAHYISLGFTKLHFIKPTDSEQLEEYIDEGVEDFPRTEGFDEHYVGEEEIGSTTEVNAPSRLSQILDEAPNHLLQIQNKRASVRHGGAVGAMRPKGKVIGPHPLVTVVEEDENATKVTEIEKKPNAWF